jgi:Flp pilus assembly protein TadG
MDSRDRWAKRPGWFIKGRHGVLRLLADDKGVTAVEFGIISAPLLGLIFAIFQSSIAFLMQQGLRAATDYAARQVLTGQAQNNGAIVDGTSFRNQLICNRGLLPSFMDCSKIVVDLRTASSFSSLGPSSVNSSFLQSDGSGAQYDSGDPCDIMIVRAAYPLPSYLPLITWGPAYQFIQNLSGLRSYKGSMVQMLSAAAVFRNEPFVYSSGSGGTSCSS